MTTKTILKLAALGVSSTTLALPVSSASGAPTRVQSEAPATDPGAGLTFISGEESDARGQSGKGPQIRPELPEGQIPAGGSTRDGAALSTGCPDKKQCMYTGGYFAGPMRWLDGGHPGTYWSWSEAKCAGSGNMGGRWKNCASSLDNNSGTYGFTVFNNSDSAPTGSWKSVPTGKSRDQLGTFNNNIERSVGVSVD